MWRLRGQVERQVLVHNPLGQDLIGSGKADGMLANYVRTPSSIVIYIAA